MDSLYEKKNHALSAVNDLMMVINSLDSCDNTVIDELNKKNETLNQMNKKLISEIALKDTEMSNMQKTIADHQGHLDELTSVKEEENKFGMLKAKDKEISNLNKEISNLNKENSALKKELEGVNSKLELMSNDNTVSCEMTDVVEETPVEISVEETSVEKTEETPVEGEEEEEEEEDKDPEPDNIEFVKKKIKGVYYGVEKGNPDSKIYALLDDGDVSDVVVGEMTNGKKKLFPVQ